MNKDMLKRGVQFVLLVVLLIAVTSFLKYIERPTTDFTIALLPDTQFYAESHPQHFEAQAEWLAEHKDSENIKFAIGLGDIVQNDNTSQFEWERMSDQFQVIEAAELPYSVLPGNHDMDVNGNAELYNIYFPEGRFIKMPWYGGNFDGTNRNNYTFFESEGIEFIIVSLEYCPADEVAQWARDIFAEYEDKIGILATHSFLDADNKRANDCNGNSLGSNTGVNLWNKVVLTSPNVQYVVSGHAVADDGAAYRFDELQDGRIIYQFMTNYQDRGEGGDGMLRLMTFSPVKKTVHITTYSPSKEYPLKDSGNEFIIPFEY